MLRIAAFIGSLRKDSINLKLTRALAKLQSDRLDIEIVPLHDLPMYNDDLLSDPPAAVTRLKQKIRFADGVLLVTPEYNRSVSPVIKNAIDWGTRPMGENSWSGKPAGIIGASPGAIGTASAQNHLRSIAPVVGLVLMASPELYLSYKPEAFDDEDNIADEKTRGFLNGYLSALHDWVAKHK
jgi:chromate reductase, NAD(P)H dehydrogenase (quinone)